MKPEIEEDHRIGNYEATLFDKCVGSLTYPANHVLNTEDAGDEACGL